MSRLQIPESHREGFKLLSSLSESDFKKLLNTLSNIDRDTSPDRLLSTITQETEIKKNISSEITKILFSIYSLKEGFNNNISELANELLIALHNLNIEIGDKSEWNKLELRLEKLLSFDQTIGNAFKALQLLSDYDKILFESKIITDVRPAFNDKDNISTDTALIVHNLKIGYHKNDRQKEMYLALDSNDLNELKNNIERAMKKEREIKNTLKDKFLFVPKSK